MVPTAEILIDFKVAATDRIHYQNPIGLIVMQSGDIWQTVLQHALRIMQDCSGRADDARFVFTAKGSKILSLELVD